jgi:3-(3-hydroxy-phenyl)propionate hydroxylase
MEDLGFQQQWLVVDVESPEPFAVYDGRSRFGPRPGRHVHAGGARPLPLGVPQPGERPEDFDHAKVLELIRPAVRGDIDKLTFLRQATHTFRASWLTAGAGRVFRWRRRFHLPRRSSTGHVPGPRRGQPGPKPPRRRAGQSGSWTATGRAPPVRATGPARHLIGWLMTGGTACIALIRRAALRLATRIPAARRARWTHAGRLREGPRAPRRRDPVVGRLCPQPRVGGALSTTCRHGLPSPGGPDLIAAHDVPTRSFDRSTTVSASTTSPRRALPACSTARADALLLRPDRIVSPPPTFPTYAWRRHFRAAGIHPAEAPQK